MYMQVIIYDDVCNLQVSQLRPMTLYYQIISHDELFPVKISACKTHGVSASPRVASAQCIPS